MIFDMHTHTNLSSCSTLDVHDMIDEAGKLDLDGVCITDHQTMDVRHQIKEGPQSNGLIVIVGMEYDTPDGDFLIFGPYEEIPPGMGGEALLNHVKTTGGVAVAAHPFRKGRMLNETLVQNRLCHVAEGINGRNSDIENLKFDRLRKRYGLTEIGGSDAHTLTELGRAVTRFSAPIRSRKDLIYALDHSLCEPGQRQHLKTALPY
jgi:predicted metal-dependent phosphoesterase TrpH